MTGTLPSIPLAQNIDENGLPQSGCRLFIFEANTSTPVIAYKDYLLSVGMEHSHPIVADALGRIPMFFLPDGYYRARCEDRYGTPLYDEAVLPVLGTGEGEGGEPGPATIQFQTGDFWWQPVAGARTGWVRANARTIGNALSGASERANADAANLFSFLWQNFDDTLCPVPGGRGANAVADFDGNKVITTLDMRGFAAMGLDGMGNTLRTALVNVPVAHGDVDTAGSLVGINQQIMTLAQMPLHNHNATSVHNITATDAGHTHPVQNYIQDGASGSGAYARGTIVPANLNTGVGVASITISGSITTDVLFAGGNETQNNVPYSVLGTWYLRL